MKKENIYSLSNQYASDRFLKSAHILPCPQNIIYVRFNKNIICQQNARALKASCVLLDKN